MHINPPISFFLSKKRKKFYYFSISGYFYSIATECVTKTLMFPHDVRLSEVSLKQSMPPIWCMVRVLQLEKIQCKLVGVICITKNIMKKY